MFVRTALLIALVHCAPHPASADAPPTRAEVEQDLVLEAQAVEPTRVRPGAPVRVAARLVNRSTTRTHKVIEPGNGCAYGIVEPHVFYTARFTPHGDAPREIRPAPFRGMCGMGDYRWHRLVADLAPGASLDVGARLSHPNALLDMKAPGRYAVRVHYAFTGRGTTQRLPQADPVGDLGPLKGHPAFEIVSTPVVFDVLRPLEVFVEPIGTLEAGATRPLSTLVRVRFENGRDKGSVTLDNTRLKIFVELRTTPKGPRIEREPMALPAVVMTKTLAPGEGIELVGPAGGWFDEEWTPEGADGAELRVAVAGYESGAPKILSHWVRVPGA